ncbi:Uncharacterized protein DAT39_005206 [Clarias magur]|uniref:Uncharacterized protein n=1 Tax=Clarias magur TaxID=1594786 RepID=A0A8J4UT03_CLAMG|nr:Uncharacterized protein DAT39_005206 [Clarias magur]
MNGEETMLRIHHRLARTKMPCVYEDGFIEESTSPFLDLSKPNGLIRLCSV